MSESVGEQQQQQQRSMEEAVVPSSAESAVAVEPSSPSSSTSSSTYSSLPMHSIDPSAILLSGIAASSIASTTSTTDSEEASSSPANHHGDDNDENSNNNDNSDDDDASLFSLPDAPDETYHDLLAAMGNPSLQIDTPVIAIDEPTTSTSSDEDSFSVEDAGRLYAKRMTAAELQEQQKKLASQSAIQENEALSHVQSIRGLMFNDDLLQRRIQRSVGDYESTLSCDWLAKRDTLCNAVKNLLDHQRVEHVLSLEDALKEEQLIERFAESSSAASVHELAVFAIYVQSVLRQRATLSYSDLASADAQLEEYAQPLLSALHKAFRVSDTDAARICRPYRAGVEHNLRIAAALFRRLSDMVDKREYHSKMAFGAGNGYSAWFHKEVQYINNRLSEIDNTLRSIRDAREKAQSAAAAAAASRSSASVAAAAASSSASSSHKSSSSFFFCCGSAVHEDDRAAPAPAHASATHTTAATTTTNTTTSTSATSYDPRHPLAEQPFIDHISELQSLDGYMLLLKVLLQDDTSVSGVMHPVFTFKTVQKHQLPAPTGIATEILDVFADTFRIGAIYRSIKYAQLLAWNLNTSMHYFASCSQEVNTLYTLWTTDPEAFTAREAEQFRALVKDFSSWPLACLSRYQFVFAEDSSALKEALLLLTQVTAISSELHRDASPPSVADLVSKEISNAARYYFKFAADVCREHGVSGADTQFARFTIKTDSNADGFTDSSQLLLLFQSISSRLRQDLDLEHVFDTVCGVAITPLTGEVYMGQIWNKAQQFLRLLSTIDWAKHDKADAKNVSSSIDELLVRVFDLYTQITEFYAFVDRNVRAMPPSDAHSWFEPFVEQWLARVMVAYDHMYVTNLVSTDPASSISSNERYSASIIHLFSALHLVCSRFAVLPFAKRHMSQLVAFVCKTVSDYVELQAELVDKVLVAEDKKQSFWGFQPVKDNQMNLSIASSVFTRMNCVHIAKRELVQLFAVLHPDRAYDWSESEPSTSGNGSADGSRTDATAAAGDVTTSSASVTASAAGATAATATASPTAAAAVDIELAEEVRGWRIDATATVPADLARVYPLCVRTLDGVTERVNKLVEHLASGMCIFVNNHVQIVAELRPLDQALSDDVLLNELRAVFTVLTRHLSWLRQNLYSYLLCSTSVQLLTQAMLFMERMLVYPKKNDYTQRLYRTQVVRVARARDELREFLRTQFGLPAFFMAQVNKEPAIRLDYILWLLQTSSDKLIHECEALDDDAATDAAAEKLSFAQREQYRLTHMPHMFRSQIASVLRFRVELEHEQDPEVIKFVAAVQARAGKQEGGGGSSSGGGWLKKLLK